MSASGRPGVLTPIDDPLVARVRRAVTDELTGPPPGSTTDDLVRTVRRVADAAAPLLPAARRRDLVADVLADVTGLGPLDRLLRDPEVNEIMVNGGADVWVERRGLLHHVGRLPDGTTDVLIERILAPLGRRLDRQQPTVDARLPDGSRVCAAIPPVAVDGPLLCIRRFHAQQRTVDAFTGDEDDDGRAVTRLVEQIVAARCNVLISGPTSSGKTTLLAALAAICPSGERIVTIEDTAELSLRTEHVVRLEGRDATADGVGAVTLAQLLHTALRLRPDRLVVGEVRGPEAVTLVQAMNTGHDGSLATCHANDPVEALRRLETMVLLGAPAWPLDAIREQVRSALDVIVHVGRRPDGRRAITRIVEIAAADDGPLRPSDMVRALVADGVVVGELTRVRTPGRST